MNRIDPSLFARWSLPHGSIEAVLADLDPASVDDGLAPALARAFPRFQFSLARIDDSVLSRWADQSYGL